jgi:glycosyltransferase involved in cell wall biosynthesis
MRRLYDCFGRQAGLRSHDISMLLWGYFVSPSCPQSAPRGRSGQLRILWVGRMLRWKRVDTLVHAASSLLRRGVAVHLDLFGLGPEEVHLRHLAGAWTQREYSCAGNAGPAIVFHRPISMDDVRRRMRESDVYVLPSSGYEGWGTVLNEAMLEGCAVIATHDGGAAKTLIRDGVNGLLFRAGDTAGLVAALARLEVDEALRLRLATAGQQTLLAEWTPDVAADRLLVMAEALTAGRAFAGFPHGPLMAVRAADDEAGGGEP